MHRGFIKLWRKLQDNELWREHRVFSKAEAWIDILWSARHSEDPIEVIVEMHTVTCGQGQCVMSLRTWARRWNWTKDKTARFMKLLRKRRMIATETLHGLTRLTVCNYDTYNGRRDTSKTGSATATRQQRDSNATATRQNKNVETVNNEENGDKNTTAPAPSTTTDAFNRLVEAYPAHKRSRLFESLDMFKKLGLASRIDEVLARVEDYKVCENWVKDGGKYVPCLLKWLERRLFDEFPPSPPPKRQRKSRLPP